MWHLAYVRRRRPGRLVEPRDTVSISEQSAARLTAIDVARILKCNPATVRRMAKEGSFPKPPITRQQLLDWMQANLQ